MPTTKPPVAAPKKEERQAVVVLKDSTATLPAQPEPAVTQQDTAHKDTAESKRFHFEASSEVVIGKAKPGHLDTIYQDSILQMPPQGPEKTADTLVDTWQPRQDQSDIVFVLPPTEPKLMRYTPSSMLRWGQWEAKYFQQVYSQTHYFDGNGNPQPQNARSTYYSGIASVLFGANAWFNFGAEAWLKSVRIDATDSSPFKVLAFQSGLNSRTAVAAIGPKLKFRPFKKAENFTLQTSLLIPVAQDLEGRSTGRPYLATANLQWWTQFYYSRSLARRWLLFAELDAYALLNTGGANQHEISQLALPVSAFLSFFPTNRLTLYAMNQVWPTSSSVWYQAGLGGKFRFSEQFEIELSYGRFLAGINAAGQANAFNLGLRFVKW